MPRTLSSYRTIFFKVLFPTMWISMFGMGTIGVWTGVLHGREGDSSGDFLKWLIPAFWILGSTVILLLCARLKRVRIDATSLYVSNYLTEIAVPLNMISKVSQSPLTNQVVTLHFRSTTKFGDKIVFLAAERLWGFGGAQPVAAEIKRAAGLS